MAIKAIFVGINKHLDTSIPELGGARRDATALWALFTDTIEGLSGRLLVDEAATHAEVLYGTPTSTVAATIRANLRVLLETNESGQLRFLGSR